MNNEKALDMIDEYLLEPNNVHKEWVELLSMFRKVLAENVQLKAEIESLEAENKLLIDRNCELAEKGEKAIITLVKSQNEIKSESVKEFAEQVKMAFYYEFDELIPSIMADKIDNLVKEMKHIEEGDIT